MRLSMLVVAMAALAACEHDPFRTTPALTSSGVAVKVAPEESSIIARFQKDFEAADTAPNNAATARAMYYSGVALVNARCAETFEYLGKARQNLTALQRGTGIAGGITATVMGLTSASAKAIALAAAGFTTAMAGYEVYGDVYLFSPDVSGVQKLVTDAQAAFRKTVSPAVDAWLSEPSAGEKLPGAYFASAHGFVRDYQSICEVQTIRRLVNEAVAAGEIETDGTTYRDRLLGTAQDTLRRTAAATLGVSEVDLSDARLAAIYAAVARGEAGNSTVEKLLSGLKTRDGKASAADGLRDARTAEQIRLLLLGLDPAQEARLRAAADRLLQPAPARSALWAAPAPGAAVAPPAPTTVYGPVTVSVRRGSR